MINSAQELVISFDPASGDSVSQRISQNHRCSQSNLTVIGVSGNRERGHRCMRTIRISVLGRSSCIIVARLALRLFVGRDSAPLGKRDSHTNEGI